MHAQPPLAAQLNPHMQVSQPLHPNQTQIFFYPFSAQNTNSRMNNLLNESYDSLKSANQIQFGGPMDFSMLQGHKPANNSYMTAQLLQPRQVGAGGFHTASDNSPRKNQQIRNSISNFRKKILFQKMSSSDTNQTGGLIQSCQRTTKLNQVLSPTKRTAAIPTRKRKPRDEQEQLIRVEDDLHEPQRHVSAQVTQNRNNRFCSNEASRLPKHSAALAGLNISEINPRTEMSADSMSKQFDGLIN